LKKALIIEIGTSHLENIYSQVLFFKRSGYEVSLALNDKVKKRTEYLSEISSVKYYSFENFIAIWKSNFLIRRNIITSNYSAVLLHSANGALVRNLLMLSYPEDIIFAGVLHNTDNLLQSFSQKIISKKIKKYFVLADYMLEYLPEEYKSKTESTYTIFLPEYSQVNIEHPKKDNEFRICIPGTVEYSRRDYNGLIEELSDAKLNSNVKFVLLGPGNYRDSNMDEILEKIEELGLRDNFISFYEFVDDMKFYNYVKSCDAVLPLIHADNSLYEKFIRYKISGSYNIAYAFKLPLICHKSMGHIDDFRENGIFYDHGYLIELINKFSNDKTPFENLKNKMYKFKKWEFEFQREKYINFLESL
jgi:hypothetical protein